MKIKCSENKNGFRDILAINWLYDSYSVRVVHAMFTIGDRQTCTSFRHSVAFSTL